MLNVSLRPELISGTNKDNWEKYLDQLNEKNKALHEKTGAGSEFTGWVDLPEELLETQKELYADAYEFFSSKDAVVCIGIGGSYLGTKAVLSALKPEFDKSKPEIIFAGHHLDSRYHNSVLEYLKDKNFGIIVISKSGTTTEPAVAFRFFKDLLEKQGKSKELNKHIIAITDPEKGALRKLADELSLKSYIVPNDIGGRYSVFSPVGILPLLVAGINTNLLIEGAANMSRLTHADAPKDKNPALIYATFRKMMWENNKKVEILSNTEPMLSFIAEWWKQLFGESEGKEGKGLLPVSINLTTDLHSLGQYIQEGNRMFFESFIKVKNPDSSLVIPSDSNNFDGLDYLAGKPMSFVNEKAAEGTIKAHADAGIDIVEISLDKTDEFNIGELLYFYEKACGISAYSIGVNPFNQPGVEAYKKNMFQLLKS